MLLENIKPDTVIAPKPNPKYDKYKRLPFASVAILIPLPGMMTTMMLIYNKQNYICRSKCIVKGANDQTYCYLQCDLDTTNYVVNKLQKAMQECSKTKNPKQCRSKLIQMLITWKKRQVKAQIQYKTYTNHLKRTGR